ncbi:hypothetical protein GCM10027271_28060 [Saccharopolyspora gloriosae]|uniref:Bifunctional DNA-binding transcriptional regulator/antitoxin component of YhaV-PrlF toxin-antitoxin module n=1 Tax=Saccharopolyspora gloriosae TaxID=455344 RepID=A0A840NFZ3_9PSEU|nr:AbrB/MazE/SpoVT family DNA-binding domain-containing protein [Saccharopolyspora gloriosae]MBB5071356.1 bifunctional DNA-binding transcriptional regulator/antitoxin component of YhaV-PrlF toxin-antitoxin module [Saccharopolyspora gloriosae]
MDSTEYEGSAEATVTAQGRSAIPKEVRQAAGREPGTKAYITAKGTGGRIVLETRAQKIQRLRTTLTKQLGADSPSLADELAADRSRDARRESGAT